MENDNLMSLEKTLLDALDLIEKSNSSISTIGACLYTPPSGPVKCFQFTPEQCSAIKGVFIGGDCPKTDAQKTIDKTDLPDSPILENTDELNYTCNLSGSSYSAGSVVCILGKEHVCGKDGWVNLGKNC